MFAWSCIISPYSAILSLGLFRQNLLQINKSPTLVTQSLSLVDDLSLPNSQFPTRVTIYPVGAAGAAVLVRVRRRGKPAFDWRPRAHQPLAVGRAGKSVERPKSCIGPGRLPGTDQHNYQVTGSSNTKYTYKSTSQV